MPNGEKQSSRVEGFYNGVTVPPVSTEGSWRRPATASTEMVRVVRHTPISRPSFPTRSRFSAEQSAWRCIKAAAIHTANSQFFIMFDEGGSFLNGQYTVIGEVVSGKSVVSKLKREQSRHPIPATSSACRWRRHA